MTGAAPPERRSPSGGSMHRLTTPPRDLGEPDLSLLEAERRTAYDVATRPSGTAPFFGSGDVVTWHYGLSADVVRVVRDDERGLVAWLPGGSETLASVAVDGRDIRDRPLAERFTATREFQVRPWRGPGVLRIAPTRRPWSIWYFRHEDETSWGQYLNIELTHERPVDGAPRVHTRDLILDLWVENGVTWIKDADELETVVGTGRYRPEQADVVRAAAEQARREQIGPRAWPLDEPWEEWSPPPGWDAPLTLPAEVVEAVSGSGQPVRRTGDTSTPPPEEP